MYSETFEVFICINITDIINAALMHFVIQILNFITRLICRKNNGYSAYSLQCLQ